MPKPRCSFCKKVVDVEFAVKLADGYAHQSCFQKGL